MGVKELGLRFPAVATFGIPPAGTLPVKDASWGASHSNRGPRDRNQGTSPFFVAKCSGPLEGHLKVAKVVRKRGVRRAVSEDYTLVPDWRPVRSSVSPAGTAISFKMMVEQAVLDWLTAETSLNVQLEALSDRILELEGTAATMAKPALRERQQNLMNSILRT